MAIARDTTASGVEVGASSLTFSHTCAANAVLWVAFYTSGTVSTVKYNNVSMTFVNSHNLGGSVTYLYVLKNPSSGAHSVAITLTGNADTNASSFSYTGANVSSQPGANADGGQSASNPFTTSLTTTYAGSWMVLTARNSATGSTSAGTGSSSVLDTGGLQIYDTNATVPVGSNSMQVGFASGTTGTVIAEMVGVATSVTVTDTGTRTEALSFVNGLWVSVSESLLNIIDKILPFRIFSKATKSSTTWTNQSKS